MFDPTAYFERSRDPKHLRYHTAPARVTNQRAARKNALLAVLIVIDPFEEEPHLAGSRIARVVQDGWLLWVDQRVRFRVSLRTFLEGKRQCRRCDAGLPCVGTMAALEALDTLGAQFVDPRDGAARLTEREHFEFALGEAGPEFTRPPPRSRFGGGDENVAALDALAGAAKTLGLSVGASRGAIVSAHRALILKLHPDRAPEAEREAAVARAAAINAARDVLLAHLPPAE